MTTTEQGADAALGALVGDRWRALVAYAYLLTADLAAAEDLVQDAVVKTLVRRHDVAPHAVEAFVRRAIVTTFIDTYRRSQRFAAVRHLLARPENTASHDHAVAARQDVQQLLRTLPAQQRTCVVLRFYDDLTTAEIAIQLGLAEGTVKRYLSIAMPKLKANPTTFDDDSLELVVDERS